MIVVAGGGTGGHVYPALAIADALVASGVSKSEIKFVGSARALEARVVPAAGYDITLLPGRGIKRRIALSNLAAIGGLLFALTKAIFFITKWRPEVVISVGGYAAAPAAFAAVLFRRPVVVAESNAIPGAVNRIISKRAAVNAVAWPDTPSPDAVVTGNPVRPEIVAIDRSESGRNEARMLIGQPEDRKLVVVFGGSLGARSINTATVELAALWRDRGDVTIHHVVGKRDWSPVEELPASDDRVWYRQFAYEEHMERLYAAADVVVCRAGATTSAEIAVAGVPSVLVPLPHAPGDHQTANAMALVKAGAANLLKDSECSAQKLAEILGPLLDDVAKLQSMGTAAKTLGRPDAASRVAELVLSAIKSR